MRRLLAVAAAIALTAGLSAAPAHATSRNSTWASVRAATAAYHDLATAQRAGWSGLFSDVHGVTCILDPTAGGMGNHWVDADNIGSTDPMRPAALVYGNGRLAALEYLVVEPEQGSAPTVNGQEMMWIPPGNRFLGDTGFYALHVWLWMHNPGDGSGMPPMFSTWNPRVTGC